MNESIAPPPVGSVVLISGYEDPFRITRHDTEYHGAWVEPAYTPKDGETWMNTADLIAAASISASSLA